MNIKPSSGGGAGVDDVMRESNNIDYSMELIDSIKKIILNIHQRITDLERLQACCDNADQYGWALVDKSKIFVIQYAGRASTYLLILEDNENRFRFDSEFKIYQVEKLLFGTWTKIDIKNSEECALITLGKVLSMKSLRYYINIDLKSSRGPFDWNELIKIYDFMAKHEDDYDD